MLNIKLNISKHFQKVIPILQIWRDNWQVSNMGMTIKFLPQLALQIKIEATLE